MKRNVLVRRILFILGIVLFIVFLVSEYLFAITPAELAKYHYGRIWLGIASISCFVATSIIRIIHKK